MPQVWLDEPRKEILHFCLSQCGRQRADCAKTRWRWMRFGMRVSLRLVKREKARRHVSRFTLTFRNQRATARRYPCVPAIGSWNVQEKPGEFVLILVQMPLFKSEVH